MAYFYAVHRRSLRVIQKWQTKHLASLIGHAARNIPLWKKIVAQAHLELSNIDLVTLQKMPLTNKETYLGKNPEEYMDTSRWSPHVWVCTSGTSGKPFRSVLSELYAMSRSYSDFASYRFLSWRGVPLHKIFHLKVAQIRIRSFSSANRLFIPISEFRTDPADVISKLQIFQPEILVTYPSVLLDIADTLEKDPALEFPSIPFVVSFGEMLSSATRARVNKVLGCEVYDRYGLDEVGVVGVECAAHNGFHINSESVIVEVTDEAGVPRPAGTWGKVIVTDLLNYNMPFIRYDTGDHGVLSTEPCTCGLRTPRIWIEGRYSAYLTFAGRHVNHLEFEGLLDGYMNEIYQYQVVKRSDSDLCIRLVRSGMYQAETGDKIIRDFQDLLGPEVNVSIQFVSRLPQTESGKSYIVKDESVTVTP